MADSYFFDKRVLKKGLIKYFIIFILILPIFIGLNVLLDGLTADWVIILIDIIVGVLLIFSLGFLYDKINNKRIARKEEKIKEFRKRQKLEASIAENENESVEIKEERVPKKKNKRKRRNKNKRIING